MRSTRLGQVIHSGEAYYAVSFLWIRMLKKWNGKKSKSVLFWEMQLLDCVCKREVESLRFRRKRQCLNLCSKSLSDVCRQSEEKCNNKSVHICKLFWKLSFGKIYSIFKSFAIKYVLWIIHSIVFWGDFIHGEWSLFYFALYNGKSFGWTAVGIVNACVHIL